MCLIEPQCAAVVNSNTLSPPPSPFCMGSDFCDCVCEVGARGSRGGRGGVVGCGWSFVIVVVVIVVVVVVVVECFG